MWICLCVYKYYAYPHYLLQFQKQHHFIIENHHDLIHTKHIVIWGGIDREHENKKYFFQTYIKRWRNATDILVEWN